MAPEIRPIPGCEGYLVSDEGRVFSRKRGGQRGLAGSRVELVDELRELAQFDRMDRNGHPTGYLSVQLGHARTRHVHAVVMLAFEGPRPPGMDVCHRDDNRSNNRRSNLRYDTKKGNTADRIRAGTQYVPDGFASAAVRFAAIKARAAQRAADAS